MNLRKVLITASLAGIAAFGMASEASVQQARMQAGMNSYCQAIKNHHMADANRIVDNYFSPNAVFIDTHGKKSSYADWKRNNEQGMKMLSSLDDISLHCNNFTIKGNSGMSMEHFHMSAKVKGPKGKISSLTVDTMSRVDYSKMGGKWMVVKSTEVKNSVMMDGHPIRM